MKNKSLFYPFYHSPFLCSKATILTTDVFRSPNDYLSASKQYASAAVLWFNKFRFCWSDENLAGPHHSFSFYPPPHNTSIDI